MNEEAKIMSGILGAALGAVLSLCIVGTVSAQEATSTEDAMRASGATDPQILDLAREVDEALEEQSAAQERLLEQLERSTDPEKALQEHMDMPNAEPARRR
jgi:hypothetical protein